MTAVPKNVYFDVLDNNVDKYNNAYHNTIKMKPIDHKSNSYAKYNVDSNAKDAKFKIGDHVRISKYKNIFGKGYAPNWSKEVFVNSRIKNIVPWTFVITLKCLIDVTTTPPPPLSPRLLIFQFSLSRAILFQPLAY